MPSTIEQAPEQDANWDGSPLTKQAWYNDLPRRVRAHRSLWERGFITLRGVIYTSTEVHSYHLSINNIETCTFEKPCPLRAFRLEDPTETTQILSDAKKKKYVDEPTQLDESDKNFFEDIIETIDNKQRQRDYRVMCKGSGIALLIKLAEEIARMNDDMSAWAVEHRAKLVLRGLTAPTVIAFDQYRQAYEDFTSQMGSRAEPDSVTAKVYVTAVKDLGDLTATKVDLKVATDKPNGDLVKTVELLTEIVTQIETAGARPGTSGTGHGRAATGQPARTGTDPQRDRFFDAAGKRIYVRGADDPCAHCHEKGKVGHHLRKDCADRPDRPDRGDSRVAGGKDKKETPRKGSTRAASGGDGDDDVTYDDGTEGVDISGADIALSTLFDGGARTAKVAAAPEGSGTARAPGAARALSARERPPPQSESDDEGEPRPSPPPAAAPAVVAQPATPLAPIASPSYLPVPEARRRVSALTPDSPMSAFRSVQSDTGSDVSMRTGGTDHRDRRRILEEMRAEIGLRPLAVPMGLALAPAAAAPTRLGDDLEHVQLAVALEASGPSLAPAPAPVAPTPVPVDERRTTLPGLPGRTFTMEGAVTTIAMQRVADGNGGLQHVYTVTHDGVALTARCPASGPTERPVPPAGALLLGTDVDGGSLWTHGDRLLLTPLVAAPPAATVQPPAPTGAAPTSSLLLFSIASLLAVIVCLLAVIAGGGGTPGGHASLAAPYHDPGTWHTATRALQRHTSLRGLGAMLLQGSAAVASCTHACMRVAVATAMRTYAGLGWLLLPLLAAVATPMSTVAAVLTSSAIAVAAAFAAYRLARTALAVSAALGTSLRGGVLLSRIILPKLLPRRLTAVLGRVFPQIPPTGYSTIHAGTKRRECRSPALFIHRPCWHSRFQPLRQRCNDDLVRTPGIAPWLLPWVICQLAVVAALDLGARAVDLRTTRAGSAPHAPILTLPHSSPSERVITASRRAGATATHVWHVAHTASRSACHSAAMLALVGALHLVHVARSEPHPTLLLLRTMDELAGWLIGHHVCHAVLHLRQAPYRVATRARQVGSALSNLTMHLMVQSFVLIISAGFVLDRWCRRASRVASAAAGVAWTAVLLCLMCGELSARGSTRQSVVSAVPLPSGVPELPPAAAAAVARLTGRATVPHVGSAHVSAHSGAPVPTRESVGPEQ